MKYLKFIPCTWQGITCDNGETKDYANYILLSRQCRGYRLPLNIFLTSVICHVYCYFTINHRDESVDFFCGWICIYIYIHIWVRIMVSILYIDTWIIAGQLKATSTMRRIQDSLAFVRGIPRWPMNFPQKGPVTRKIFPFDDVIMRCCWVEWELCLLWHLLPFSELEKLGRMPVIWDAMTFMWRPEVISLSVNILGNSWLKTQSSWCHDLTWKLPVWYDLSSRCQ